MNTRTTLDESHMNRHERRKLHTRARLKEATLTLVLEKGYNAVNIQDIVDLADLGRGTFYVHYSDKQDILWDIIQDGLQASMAEGARRSQQGTYPPGYLGYLITFETAAKNRDLYLVMLGSQGSALITHRAVDYLASAIQQGIETRTFMQDYPYPPDILAQYVVGALTRLMLWWLETPNTYTPKDMADILYHLLHGVNLNAPPAAIVS